MRFNLIKMEDALESLIDYRGKTPKKSETGIMTLSAKSVKNNHIDYSQCYFISEEEYKRFMVRGIPKKGDILLTTEAPLGCVARLDRDDVAIAQRLLTLRGKKQVLDNDYLLYYLQSPIGQASLKARESGTTVTGIKQSEFKKIELMIPDYEAQRYISSILRTIDKKIELNNAINNILEQQSILLFKDWFTNFRNADKDMLHTQFGVIPSSYKLMKNSDLPIVITDYVANGSFASLKANVTLYQEENYSYFIRNTDLKSGNYGVFVDKHSYEFLSKSKLFGGELIISNVGDVGSVYLCPKLNKAMTLGNNMILLRPEQENLNYYLYIWFKWGYGKSLIQGITGGSAQPKFNKTDFKNLLIYLPDDVLLERFHQLVKPMYKLIENNNFESQILIDIRNSLLPKLLSGEVDVSNIKL